MCGSPNTPAPWIINIYRSHILSYIIAQNGRRWWCWLKNEMMFIYEIGAPVEGRHRVTQPGWKVNIYILHTPFMTSDSDRMRSHDVTYHRGISFNPAVSISTIIWQVGGTKKQNKVKKRIKEQKFFYLDFPTTM